MTARRNVMPRVSHPGISMSPDKKDENYQIISHFCPECGNKIMWLQAVSSEQALPTSPSTHTDYPKSHGDGTISLHPRCSPKVLAEMCLSVLPEY